MKRKAIHIDWDELEAAFENRSEDLSYYLDTVTGQVGLEGQGEDAHFDDDEIDGAVEAAPAKASAETTRLVIASYSDLDELDWMDEFIEGEGTIPDALKDKLGDLVAREDGNGFKDQLRHHAEVRDRWFLFRSERVHEVMDAWLEENRVTPAGPPPWKER
ncbi:MAG TPA: UPF0158 family protein [Candidatus Polarisedimenticolaceae bacterium]|nr:UPF0158 family protein [Candidatus Polarisedimenticolaceae bacterium]